MLLVCVCVCVYVWPAQNQCPMTEMASDDDGEMMMMNDDDQDGSIVCGQWPVWTVDSQCGPADCVGIGPANRPPAHTTTLHHSHHYPATLYLPVPSRYTYHHLGSFYTPGSCLRR